jgi:hypothetical protein
LAEEGVVRADSDGGVHWSDRRAIVFTEYRDTQRDIHEMLTSRGMAGRDDHAVDPVIVRDPVGLHDRRRGVDGRILIGRLHEDVEGGLGVFALEDLLAPVDRLRRPWDSTSRACV